MCTAVSLKTNDHYFGRNLDLDHSYHEVVSITPRNKPLHFRSGDIWEHHYAMIGMATVIDEYSLYYEATNEKGLSVAGLNFPGIAAYLPFQAGKLNVASFEFIPWLLGQFSSVAEVKKALSEINIWDVAFSRDLSASPLHWMISDSVSSLTVEPMADGLHIYDNPVGVLTNNPPFPYQMYHLTEFINISANAPENRFSNQIDLKPYGLGFGAIGLPGDLSPASRFVKAAFTKLNSICGVTEEDSVTQFFHILASVAQQRGAVRLENNRYEITVYSSCCNTAKGIYYYTTYGNAQITGVDMHHENLNSCKTIIYPLITGQQIHMVN